MHFAFPLPWWLVVLAAGAVVGLAYLSYRRPLVPLSPARRATLMALRGLSLAAIVLVLCRPTLLLPPSDPTGLIVPVLVDVSRSMRIEDADGQSRLDQAVGLVRSVLVPRLSSNFTTEIYAVGDDVIPASLDGLTAQAQHTDLTGAIRAVGDKYRGRAVPGMVLLSDGGETGQHGDVLETSAIPVFAVGMGASDGQPDREILGMVAGDPRLDQASVDVSISAVSHGYGRSPFELRLTGNGRSLDSRTVTPTADGSPVEETFTVYPDPLNPTVYTAEIAPDTVEAVTENNARSVLVGPAGRKRRVLVIEGAPGYDHSFFARALAADPGLDVDLVVRKGRNEAGEATYFIQASGARAAELTGGFPATREALYAYDALALANVEGDSLTRAQLTEVAEFVSARGGGLLVFGGRSFAQRGLVGTPLEDVLPLELSDRRGGLTRTAPDSEGAMGRNEVSLTPEGSVHPVMRLAPDPEDNQRAWSMMPALAASAALGGPRPGATVLAVTASQNGAVHPLVAVQRYGRGRSLVFAGEASWRWRMLLPSDDRSYEYFWRQTLRWLAAPAPDPVQIVPPEWAEPGAPVTVGVDVRNGEFDPVSAARVEMTVTTPGGDTRAMTLRGEASVPGRFSATFRPDDAGAYRVQAEARLEDGVLGRSDRWIYVGGSDREFADPRLNEGLLRRMAQATGGRYVHADAVGEISSWLQSAGPQEATLERRDLWHEPWVLVTLVALLCGEWVLRRRWGLR